MVEGRAREVFGYQVGGVRRDFSLSHRLGVCVLRERLGGLHSARGLSGRGRERWEGPREVGGWGWTEAQGLIFPHGACGAFSFKVFQLGPPSSSGAPILMGAADLEMIILTITTFMAWD